MNTRKKIKRAKIKKWGWDEIKKAVDEVYDTYHHLDDWGVEVIYRESMLNRLKYRLTLITSKKK